MTRARRGHRTQVARGVYRVQVERGRDSLTGRPRRRNATIHGTAADADRAIDRIWTEMGGADAESDISLDSYLTDHWLPWVSGRIRQRTYEGYESKLRLYVIPYLGTRKLSDLDAYDIDHWLEKLRSDGHGDHTRLHAFRVLRTALRRAVKWRMLVSEPTSLVDTPRADVPVPDVLSPTEARSYIEAATGTPMAPVVALALGGGLRRSELCALTWKDVDLVAKTVTIRHGRHQHGKKVWEEDTKSITSRRTIVLSDWASELLGTRGVGRIVGDPETVSREYRDWVEDSGLRYVPLKNLRHSSATLALAGGADIALVSKRLGHSQIGVTVKHYISSGLASDHTVSSALDSGIFGDVRGTGRKKPCSDDVPGTVTELRKRK